MHSNGIVYVCIVFTLCNLPLVVFGKEKTKGKNKNVADNMETLPKEEQTEYFTIQKEVVVIGSGIAGLAAARRVASDQSNFSVAVYEARRDRFGGRVWTDKFEDKNARGLAVDLGGSGLNVVSKNNPLIELAESFDLKSISLDSLQFIVPWEQKVYSRDDLSEITNKAFQILGKALNESKSMKLDVSVKDAVDKVLKAEQLLERPEAYFVRCLPSYILGDYSMHQYKPEHLDIGYEKVLLDGMGELVDRLLSGSPDEAPLHLYLNKAARQIKVDKKRHKVLVRFQDGSQVSADRLVVAVPSSVVRDGDLLFEPPLPKHYHLAIKEIGMSAGDKIIVQFEHAFWSNDYGVFIRAVKEKVKIGQLQTWINIKRLAGVNTLASFLTGDAAVRFEKLTEENAKQLVLDVLIEMFGEEKVLTGGKIVKFQRSKWVSDEFSKGASTYPKVGSDPALWDTFAQPLCPYIYFAGEHTLFDGHGSLHGAYNSGIRAGDQIMTGLCEKQRKEKERLKVEEKKKKEANETDSAEEEDTDEEDEEISDKKRSKKDKSKDEGDKKKVQKDKNKIKKDKKKDEL
ncbi:uncharacterized protein LOC106052168 [Biomphalaria glabrata]|uniref:Amine oxidase n=1 Tax=Biomphalaria glabrata TaxID=6526 RepID=A0A9W3A2M1_BIOGL|nr:uncharacterized protein LOC106052168 [Biomphalaria glabrata]XP_055881429.1 uncharacterized protein LOC106052168 [Biomphalaria glabrata]XP_055881430.1 uncharacterized protein LOC106052168 [Biomphalaria glabrata]XP_055881431.1 uncharacterized protein LOC106052168 [Biomphalaria glabrata]